MDRLSSGLHIPGTRRTCNSKEEEVEQQEEEEEAEEENEEEGGGGNKAVFVCVSVIIFLGARRMGWVGRGRGGTTEGK